MAMIKYGSMDQFSARFEPTAFAVKGKSLRNAAQLEKLTQFSDLREASRPVQTSPLVFDESSGKRGLSLKSLKLSEEFGGILGNMFERNYMIYFLAWAWDFSGNPPVIYPLQGVPVEQIRIPLQAGKMRNFIGEGILLFPARKIAGGLALRMNMWESDKDIREMGKAIAEISDTIKQSKLTNLLTMCSLVGGVPFITADMIMAASLELANAIGMILKANSDDYVDFFEGYYPTSGDWAPGEETYQGLGCEIALRKFI